MEKLLEPQILTNLSELHTLLLEGETLERTLKRISGLACQSVAGCDSTGLTLLDGSEPTTAAATDEFTLEIDAEQYRTGEGPCLQAIADHDVFVIEDIHIEKRWPEFVGRAKEKGLRSSLSIPLPMTSPNRGALNMYSFEIGSFSSKTRQVAQLFADQAAVAISNAQIYSAALLLTEQLKEAVSSREVIGEAMGILIEREGVNQEGAFEMLKKASQASNVKLREIAERVVAQALEQKNVK